VKDRPGRTSSTPPRMTWLSGLEVHMALVPFRSVVLGAALLLISCGDPEAKAQRLLNEAQILEREGKEQEAQRLLDALLKEYPQTTAATAAHKLLNQKKVLRNLLSSVLAANETSALARLRAAVSMGRAGLGRI